MKRSERSGDAKTQDSGQQSVVTLEKMILRL